MVITGLKTTNADLERQLRELTAEQATLTTTQTAEHQSRMEDLTQQIADSKAHLHSSPSRSLAPAGSSPRSRDRDSEQDQMVDDLKQSDLIIEGLEFKCATHEQHLKEAKTEVGRLQVLLTARSTQQTIGAELRSQVRDAPLHLPPL
jgi:predicted  nucleic acid-binding Zn-ribbon protein